MARVTGENKNFSGTVGNMVFCQRKGMTYIRTKPSRIRDAKTEKQLAVRDRFKMCSNFYKQLGDDMLKHVWRMVAKETGMNSRNMFMQHNFYAFKTDRGNTDYERLQFSAGLLPIPNGLQIGRFNDQDCVLQWEYNQHENVGIPTDRLYVVELQSSGLPVAHTLDVSRSEGKAVFSTFDKINKGMYLYCFWGNKSATCFSPTHYFREIPLVEP